MSYVNIQGRRMPFIVRYMLDLLAYRHLAVNLVASDLRARFRRSYLGILWAVIQPLGFSLIIGYVWGTLFAAKSYWEYALYVFSGMIVWEYFGTVMSVSQDALLSAEGYLKQTRIPFLIFQIRTALTGLVVFLAGFAGLIGMLAFMNKLPPVGMHLLYIPAFFGVAFLFMAPLAVIMSILGTKLRDLKYITGLAVQALFFISPVMLGREIFESDKMVIINLINPMAQLINMFRQPLFDASGWTYSQMGTVAIWIGVFWVLAIWISAAEGRKLVFSL
jgi:lipopolysaccharide transport system permease protein